MIDAHRENSRIPVGRNGRCDAGRARRPRAAWPMLALLLGLAGCDLNIGLDTSMSVFDAVLAEGGEDVAHVAVEIEMPSRAKCREIGPKVLDAVGTYLQQAAGGTCEDRRMDTFLRVTGNIKVWGADGDTLEPSGATMLELVVQRKYRQIAVLVDQRAFADMTRKVAELFLETSVDLQIADLTLTLENDSREPRSITLTHVFVDGVPTLAGETAIPPRSQIEIQFSDVHRASLEKHGGLVLGKI